MLQAAENPGGENFRQDFGGTNRAVLDADHARLVPVRGRCLNGLHRARNLGAVCGVKDSFFRRRHPRAHYRSVLESVRADHTELSEEL